MTFVRRFYILIVCLARGDHLVQCTADFDETELTHLSRYLSPLECLRLLEKSYLEISPDEKIPGGENRKLTRQIRNNEWTTEKDCLINLEEWNNNYPGIRSPGARLILESGLRSLGRPDLAKYLKRNRRVVEFLSSFAEPELDDVSDNNRHSVLRRRTTDEVKDPPHRKKRKKFHRTESSKSFQKAVAVTNKDEKDENSNKSNQCLTILTALAVSVLILCGALFFLYYRKHHKRPFGLRFGRNCDEEKGKQSCVKNCGYPDASGRRACPCMDLDVESGWSTNASKYFNGRKSNADAKKPSPESEAVSICTKKPKKKKKKKQKSLKSSQDRRVKDKKRDKDKKNNNRRCRETSQQTDLRRYQEGIISILQKDCPGCECCKCSFNDKEKGKFGKAKRLQANVCNDPRCRIHVAKKIANLSCTMNGKSKTDEKIKEKERKLKKKTREKPVLVCTKKTCQRRKFRDEKKREEVSKKKSRKMERDVF